MFAGWSWEIDQTRGISKSVQMSPRTRPRIYHIIPTNDDKASCLRGRVDGDPSKIDGVDRTQVDIQRCISPKGQLYHRLPEDNFSAHWTQEYVSANPEQIEVFKKCQKHPGKGTLLQSKSLHAVSAVTSQTRGFTSRRKQLVCKIGRIV